MITGSSLAPQPAASCVAAAGAQKLLEIGDSMKKIYAGTSGWAYTTWKPDFYPAKLSSAKFLNYYAGRLNSVEVNYTFRSLPTKKLLKDWTAATPPGFKFAGKAHQTITHIKRLCNVMRVTSKFVASLLPLQKQARSGVVSIASQSEMRLAAADRFPGGVAASRPVGL